jgi:fido (protein-threonine AMPylation protein)
VLGIHKIVFEAVYPWVGQDRLQTAPDLAISKGLFFSRIRKISVLRWNLRSIAGKIKPLVSVTLRDPR